MPEHRVAGIDGSPETSESEEMYLITILRAAEEGHRGPLGLAALAARLEVAPASVNEKVRRMEDRGLVVYEPYKGASLTEAGRSVAVRVLRTRRLWACFLADRLGFSPQQADEMACDLEHATSAAATEALDEFLGHPGCDPFGAPIPGGSSRPGAGHPSEPLSGVPAGARVEVIAVVAAREVARFLASSGLQPGAAAKIEAVGPGGVLVDGPAGPVHVGPDVAETVLVRRAGSGDAA